MTNASCKKTLIPIITSFKFFFVKMTNTSLHLYSKQCQWVCIYSIFNPHLGFDNFPYMILNLFIFFSQHPNLFFRKNKESEVKENEDGCASCVYPDQFLGSVSATARDCNKWKWTHTSSMGHSSPRDVYLLLKAWAHLVNRHWPRGKMSCHAIHYGALGRGRPRGLPTHLSIKRTKLAKLWYVIRQLVVTFSLVCHQSH